MKLKRRLCIVMLLGVIFATIIFGVNNVKLANSNQDVVRASVVNTSDEFVKTYNIGVDKKIIKPSEMSQSEFVSLCKNSVYPAYLQAVKDDPGLTFQKYIADDNYEQPIEQPGDKPTTVTAESHMNSLSRTAAHNGYSMKAGDILVCYGTNSAGKYLGHAAIVTSSKFVLEMPGYGHTVWHTSKQAFFKSHSGNGKFVYVYRIKKHPYYAKYAQDYAWHHMYKKTRPSYNLNPFLYQKSPSYCSKYVYLAYYWGATKKSVKYYSSGIHYVHPHTFIGNFVGSFKPNNIHKITSY